MAKELAPDTAEPFQRYAPAQTTVTAAQVVAQPANIVPVMMAVVMSNLLANGLMPTKRDTVQTKTTNMN
jgi:hypothetical protein